MFQGCLRSLLEKNYREKRNERFLMICVCGFPPAIVIQICTQSRWSGFWALLSCWLEGAVPKVFPSDTPLLALPALARPGMVLLDEQPGL